jgi:hypothetical protein
LHHLVDIGADQPVAPRRTPDERVEAANDVLQSARRVAIRLLIRRSARAALSFRTVVWNEAQLL